MRIFVLILVGLFALPSYAGKRPSLKSELNRELEVALDEEQNEYGEAVPQRTRRKVRRKRAKRQRQRQRQRQELDLGYNRAKKPFRRRSKRKRNAVHRETEAYERLGVRATERYSMRVPRPKRKRLGINVYTFFSSASEVVSSTNSADVNGVDRNELPTGALDGTWATNSSFGLGVEHSILDVVRLGPIEFGYQGGGTYEFGRDIQREYFIGFSNSRQMGDPVNLSMLAPYGNLTMKYRMIYLFGGLNYTIPMVSQSGDEVFRGDLGYQIGLGGEVLDWLVFELAYRVNNLSVQPNLGADNDIESIERSGLGIYDDERLSMSGFLLNAKFRF